MKKWIIIIWSLIITIIKSIYLVPLDVNNSFTGPNIQRYSTIYKVIETRDACKQLLDAYCYQMNTIQFIIEALLVFIITLMITHFITGIIAKGKSE